ncbi:MAG: hypothetical protein K0M50_21830 [Prolixibacteraceae bacterium]|nr:hypothetical protein [Prolixibacteraceae bacterium]
MENTDIINLWKSYDKKLEENLVLNKKNATDITQLKVQSLLKSMRPIKVFIIITGIVWVIFVDVLIINFFHIASPFLLISAILHVLLTKLAIGIYLYQVILIYQVDISEPVLATQDKLASLKSSTLWVARLSFLQLPIWTIFYWNRSMLENGNFGLYAIQFIVTVSFVVISVWLFFNIKYENRNKKWFQLIISGIEWNPVIKSMELYHEVEEFKQDN